MIRGNLSFSAEAHNKLVTIHSKRVAHERFVTQVTLSNKDFNQLCRQGVGVYGGRAPSGVIHALRLL